MLNDTFIDHGVGGIASYFLTSKIKVEHRSSISKTEYSSSINIEEISSIEAQQHKKD
jgi:hypothetical protein